MGVISSIASVVRGNEVQVTKASLFELDDDDGIGQNGLKGIQFQYFPETISIQRGVDYQSKDPLGGSHPIYQWLTGSEKVISFKAVFTADEPSYGYALTQGQQLNNAIENIGAAVSSLARNPLATGIGALKGKTGSRFQFNIQKAASYLMSLTYPTYPKGAAQSGRVRPPPKMFLHLPNLGMSTNYKADPMNYNGMDVLLRQCNIEYSSFFRNGEPRVMEVSLDVLETIQIGTTWGFVSRGDVVAQFTTSLGIGQSKDPYQPQLIAITPDVSTNLEKKDQPGSSNPLNSVVTFANNVAGRLGVG